MLSVRARVLEVDQARFDGAAERAAALCPVSNALRGNVEIDVYSELEA